MKSIKLLAALIIGFAAHAQSDSYAITSYADEGFLAPNTHYLGEAWLHFAMPQDSLTGYGITKAEFKANSTLNWHKHGSVQVLVIVDGVGYYQERGKEPILIKEGDIIKCDPGTEHWHSSSKEHNVTYLAIYGGGTPTEWTEELTRETYDAVAEKLAASK